MGCYPLYPPLELFHSMGFAPVVLWGFGNSLEDHDEARARLQPFTCSVAGNLVQFLLAHGECLDGLWSSNACDTLRNLPEIIEFAFKEKNIPVPLFKSHIPAVSFEQSMKSKEYLKQTINTLIDRLSRHYDVSFSGKRFVQSIELYRAMRSLARQLLAYVSQGKLSFREYIDIILKGNYMVVEDQIDLLKRYIDYLKEKKEVDFNTANRARVVLSGIQPPHPEIINAIEDSGMYVAGNDIAPLTRTLNHTPDTTSDPGEYYCDFYQNHYPCSTILHSSGPRVAALKRLFDESGAAGMIFIGEKFCEYEYFEIPHIRSLLDQWGIMFLDVEQSADMKDDAGARNRIAAFGEMLLGMNANRTRARQ